MRVRNFSPSGASALFGAAFIYATFGVLVRVMADMWGSTAAQVMVRLTVAFLIATVIIMFRRSPKLPTGSMPKVIALGVSSSLMVLLYTFSVQRTTIANGVFLLYAGSMITSFLTGTLLFKEKVTARKAIAIALALVGLSLYSSAFLEVSTGVIAGLFCGFFDGVSNTLRKPLAGIDRFAILRLQYMVGALFTLVFLVFSRTPVIKQVSLLGIIVTIVYGCLLVGVGNLLLFGFQHFEVNVGTVILSTELFFAVLLGLIFYQELPAVHELVGGSLILGASVVSSVDPRILRRKRSVVVP